MSQNPLEYTALILAAGQGSRIRGCTSGPKCLLTIDNKSLLEWHLQHLRSLGVFEVKVVVGYKMKRIKDHLEAYQPFFDIQFVQNSDYVNYGNAYSMYLGLSQATQRALVFDADLIYDYGILQNLIDDRQPNQVLVGRGSLEDVECAKTLIDSTNRVRKLIDKRSLTLRELRMYRFVGEAMGVLKFSSHGREKLLSSCEYFFSNQENIGLNWEHLMNFHLEQNTIYPHFAISQRWMEIDTPEDYYQAEKMFEGAKEEVF